jgi:hypothetical protein
VHAGWTTRRRGKKEEKEIEEGEMDKEEIKYQTRG